MKKIKMKSIKHIPAVFILLIVWAALRFSNINFNEVVNAALFLAILPVVIFEFYKSGDITLKSFGWDLFTSILAVILFTAVETILIIKRYPFQIVDILFGILVIADSLVSPFNSFRTALRNFQVGESG